jgi:leucyl/phenylalanyl-tRNA--protein transferase
MFSMRGVGTDASKVCLVHLVDRLRRGGFLVCDSQYANNHMARFGVYEVSAKEYLSLLEDAVETDARWDVEGDPLQGR